MKEDLHITLDIPITQNGFGVRLFNFREFLIREFNGFRVYGNIKGYWKNPKTQKTEIDNNIVIEIFTERDLNETLSILEFELKKIGLSLKQKVMFYTVNNKAYYVTVKKPKATSYYSGYEDLDKKISKLYSKQIEIESETSKLKLPLDSKAFYVLQNEHKQIMNDIKSLLEIGKQRDTES